MITSRRNFFFLAAGLASMPVMGIARVAGVIEKPAPRTPFVYGEVLSSKKLNEEFARLEEMIRVAL